MGRGTQRSAAATAGHGLGSSANSAKTASERSSTRSAAWPNSCTTRIVVGPAFASGKLIPCLASSPATFADSEAAKRNRS